MAFKKKAKPSKKKSKSNKKDDWTFEGGQGTDSNAQSEEQNDGRRKRRETQDRDERQRRGRAKIDDRKRKKQFTNKMSKKIKFNDVLDKEDVTVVEEHTKEPVIVRLNPLSVNDRLQLFVSKSLQSLESQREDTDNESEDDSHESNNSDEDDAEKAEPTTSTKRIASLAARTTDREVGEENIAHEDDDENHATNQENPYYDWFFSSKPAGSGPLSRALKLLNTCQNDEIYGRLHPSIQNLPASIKSLGEVPGVHKLWRGKQTDRFDEQGAKLMPYLNTFADILIEGRDHHNDADILDTLLKHTVSHVVKSRAKVIKHTEKLKKKANDAKLNKALTEALNPKDKKKSKKGLPVASSTPASSSGTTLDAVTASSTLEATESEEAGEVMQDQGFSRPRVLILCPFRGSAVQIIQTLQSVLGGNTSISGMEKLEEEFGPPEEENDEDEADFQQQKKGNSKKGPAPKPEDWDALFKQQNIDDDFKIGIQLNPGHGKGSGVDKGVYVRLFSDFFISDIILASPIGLRLAIESGGSNTAKNSRGQATTSAGDFLSSIEMVLLHQADVLYMQNWDHVDFLLKHTNNLPQSNHDTDFSRVRPYFLDGNGASHRQLMMSTHFVEPEIQAFFREHGKSQSGSIRLKKNWNDGSLVEVLHSVRQVFQMVPSITSFEEQEDVRFRYFKDTVLAQIQRTEQKHTLIVTPSYLNYVRVRNELMHQQINAAYVCEYSRDSEVSRGRSRFYHGTKDVLLYSGRAHFFRRFQIKGARHIIFYSLPEYAHFYAEMVNLLNVAESEEGDLGGQNAPSCLVLYTPYERMALERLVGKKRCDHMMSSKKATFMFC